MDYKRWIKSHRKTSAILLLLFIGFAPWRNQISPAIDLELVYEKGDLVPDFQLRFHCTEYPSSNPRFLDFGLTPDGKHHISRQTYWTNLCFIICSEFLDVVLPHGNSGHSASFDVTAPEGLELVPEKSGATLVSKQMWNESESGMEYFYSYSLPAKDNMSVHKFFDDSFSETSIWLHNVKGSKRSFGLYYAKVKGVGKEKPDMN